MAMAAFPFPSIAYVQLTFLRGRSRPFLVLHFSLSYLLKRFNYKISLVRFFLFREVEDSLGRRDHFGFFRHHF
jgi:hypothetical protein